MASASTNSAAADRRGTVDPVEIARFAAMADEWWDPNGKFRPLHRLNPVRLGFIRARAIARFGRDPEARQPLAGLGLVDVGCGGGLLCEPMARLGARVVGIDAGERNIGVARAHAAESGLDIDYRAVTAEALDEAGERFDIVLNMEVVEHVADLDAFLEASAHLLAPGGMMIVATLNRTLKSFALAKIGAEYVLRWLPRGTHDWSRFVRPSELASGLRRADVVVAEMTGIAYNPLQDAWSLSRDLSVNYMAVALPA